jgi:hypothetical protein
MHKRLSDIKFVTPQNNNFYLIAKFFPENTTELIQEYTQHLFYLQVRDSILKEEIECVSEDILIKLASYAAQSKYGDFIYFQESNSLLKTLVELELPKSILNKQNQAELERELCSNWGSLDGFLKEEVELEYLKLASSLEMFGVTYILTIDKKNTQIWLGICSLGVKICLENKKTTPIAILKWSDIVDLKLSKKKIKIKFNKQNISGKGRIETYTFQIEDSKQDLKNVI